MEVRLDRAAAHIGGAASLELHRVDDVDAGQSGVRADVGVALHSERIGRCAEHLGAIGRDLGVNRLPGQHGANRNGQRNR